MAIEVGKTGIDVVGDVAAWVLTFVYSMRRKTISSTR